MCGIFGACLKPSLMNKGMSKAAIAKFKILGLYNQDRGKHSCGVFMNDQIIKGVDKEKVFCNFIENRNLPMAEPEGNHVMIGHTRQATGGQHNETNAHPFMIDDNFVLAHNGVIRNIWSLCFKYGVDYTNIDVDSMALAEVINKEGFKVLNEYEGFAALLMTRISEPNSLFIYRGVSPLVRGGEMKEERPLWMLQTEEGIYVSSIENSLRTISDSAKDKISEVEPNIVHKITNGRMTNSKYSVDRSTANVGVSTATHGGDPSKNYPKPGTGQQAGMPPKATGNHTSTAGTTNSSVGASHSSCSPMQPPFAFEQKTIPVIWHETMPSRVEKYGELGGMFFHMGRYWLTRHGDISMAHGQYAINKRGMIKSQGDNSIKEAHNYFFYQGILMKDEKNYKIALVDNDLKNRLYNFAAMVSKYTEMPVCNTRDNIHNGCGNCSDYVKHRWYQNSSMCSNTGFTPKFSDRNYILKDGLLHTITGQSGFEKEMNIDTESLRAERSRVETRSGIHVQNPKKDELPFPPIPANTKDSTGVKLTASLTDETDLSNFFRVWDSLDQALQTLTIMERNAIRYYVSDVMMQEMMITPTDIYDDAVDVQANIFISMCIENRLSLYDQWDVKNYKDCLDYLLVAKENPNGEIFDTNEVFVGENEISDNCPLPPAKPVNFMSMDEKQEAYDAQCKANLDYVRSMTLKIEEDMARARSENNLRVVTDEEGDANDDKENMIDYAISRENTLNANMIENAKIAQRLLEMEDVEDVSFTEVESNIVIGDGIEVEETTDDEELMYAAKDIYDYLIDIRGFADELQAHTDNDYAQELANMVYRSVDPLKERIRELSENYIMTEMVDHINTLERARQTTQI